MEIKVENPSILSSLLVMPGCLKSVVQIHLVSTGTGFCALIHFVCMCDGSMVDHGSLYLSMFETCLFIVYHYGYCNVYCVLDY